MTRKQLTEALSSYPEDAEIQCAVSVPDLYINTMCSIAINGDNPEQEACKVLRLVATVPSRFVGPATAE